MNSSSESSHVIIRKAIVSDMGQVLELIRELAIYEKAEREVEITVDRLVQDGFGEHPIFECIVAEVAEQVIGFALYYTSYSTWKGRCLYLEDFLVTQSWRRKGIGELLFREVYQIAKVRKAKRFEWQVLDWNTPAIEFYKKHKADLDSEWINCRIIP